MTPIRTQLEVATILGVTREAVTIAEKKALRKIRAAILKDREFLRVVERVIGKGDVTQRAAS